MIINGKDLLLCKPIVDMIEEKRRIHGVSYGLTEAGYDIRIAEEIRFTPGSGYDSVTINGVTKKGRFALASSVEVFNIPKSLLGVVHDKSTHARRGLSVFNTVLEPGWRGVLTIELAYHGEGELHLPAGTGIAQVLFHELRVPAAYAGKYQDQEAGAQEARYE